MPQKLQHLLTVLPQKAVLDVPDKGRRRRSKLGRQRRILNEILTLQELLNAVVLCVGSLPEAEVFEPVDAHA